MKPNQILKITLLLSSTIFVRKSRTQDVLKLDKRNYIYLMISFFTVLIFSGCQQNLINPSTKKKVGFLQNSIKSTSKNIILKPNLNGHTSQVRDIIVTKSGDIITASNDKTIKIWEADSYKEKRRILGEIHKGGAIYAIELNNDENILYSAGKFCGIRVYNFNTGKLIKRINYKDNTIPYSTTHLTSSSKYLVALNTNSSIMIFDILNDFKQIKSINLNSSVKTIEIIKQNDKEFLLIATLNSLKLYDINKNKFVKTFDISTINKKLVIKTMNISKKHIGLVLNSKVAIFDYDFNLLKVIKADKVKDYYEKTHLNVPICLNFSNDGKYIMLGFAYGRNNDTVKIYNIENNYKLVNSFKKIFKNFKAKNNKDVLSDIPFTFDFIKNNRVIINWYFSNTIEVIDILKSKVIKKISPNIRTFYKVGINNTTIALGEEVNSKLNHFINLKNFNIRNNNSSIKFKNTTTFNSNLKLSIKFQEKNEYGIKKRRLTLHKGKDLFRILTVNKFVNFNPAPFAQSWYKNYVISGTIGGNILIFDIDGAIKGILLGHTNMITKIAVDNNKLISTSLDKTIRMWDLNFLDGYQQFLVMNSKLNNYGFKDGDIIYKVNNIQFKTVDQLLSYIRPVANYKFYIKRDDKKIILNINKSTAKFRIGIAKKAYITIQSIINLIITKDNEYVAWTNDGFFDASKNGAKYIGYHINQGSNKEAEFVTVDALYKTFYRPDLIQKALKGEDLSKYAKNINIQKLLQDGLAPEVHILTKMQKTKNQDLDLKVQICPKNKGGYDNLTLLINNTPVSVIDTSRALKLKKKSQRDDCFIYDQTISLAGGKNTISFRATNKAGNIESKPDYLEVTFDDTNLKKKLRTKLSKISGSQNINDLHILAIAVNEYKDTDLTLKYSINDATEMLKTIQDVAKPLFNKVHTYKLFDKEVTKENIKQAFKAIKSTREDVFLLYIAGHGITDEYNGNYYYIPYNFISKDDEKAVQLQGVGQRDFMLGLSKITALKSLVLLDTCNSGSFVEANMQKTTTNRLAKATGRATISASSSSQVALEGYKSHGVFTYTLLEALKGKGYKNDNKITTNELSDYVEDILPKRTSKKWGYRQMPQSSMYGVDFNIGEK